MTQLGLMTAAALISACAHSVAPVQASVAAAGDTPFAAEILAFEAQDRAVPPTPGGIVFVGSSTFRQWSMLATDFPAHRPRVHQAEPQQVGPGGEDARGQSARARRDRT